MPSLIFKFKIGKTPVGQVHNEYPKNFKVAHSSFPIAHKVANVVITGRNEVEPR